MPKKVQSIKGQPPQAGKALPPAPTGPLAESPGFKRQPAYSGPLSGHPSIVNQDPHVQPYYVPGYSGGMVINNPGDPAQNKGKGMSGKPPKGGNVGGESKTTSTGQKLPQAKASPTNHGKGKKSVG